MHSRFMLKLPSPASAVNVANAKATKNPITNNPPHNLFPKSSWHYITRIPDFFNNCISDLEHGLTCDVHHIGTATEIERWLRGSRPSTWSATLKMDGSNPDIRTFYTIATLCSSLTFGAYVSDDGKWCFVLTGVSCAPHPMEGNRVEQEGNDSVPEYFSTAVQEVATLLIQNYTNYYWQN